MRNESTGRKVPKIVGHRKKLSDITNTPILQRSRANDENDQPESGSSAQELAKVKKLLAEKEETIEYYKRGMEKMWTNYCRKTKQNDEVILHNSQLYKDLTQARDKLKILEHEHTQMSATFKICKAEMQQKLDEALEQVDHLTKLLEASRSKKAPSDKFSPGDLKDTGTKHDLSSREVSSEDCLSIHGRSTSRRRNSKSYKEPLLRQKMRQIDATIMCLEGSTECDIAVDEGGKAVSTSCRTEVELSQAIACCNTESRNEAHTEAAEPYTEKKNMGKDQDMQFPDTFCVTTRKSGERPRRRTASCIGSYREPPLNTKMRRAV